MNSSFKKIFFVSVVLLMAASVHSQENRFNLELDKYCKTVIKEFRVIPAERKLVLDGMAQQLAKKKYIVFTCKTNSRRTLILQVWAQTSFYYYGVYGRYAFSIGDTVTNVYPGVIDVLKESGFFCTNQKNAEPSQYVISINKEFPINMLSSKNEVGTIDTNKGVVVNICFNEEEPSIIAGNGHVNLPYKSPTAFEKTKREKQKYRVLNHQIALEMLYLAERTKALVGEFKGAAEY
jgi:hypothetical protein